MIEIKIDNLGRVVIPIKIRKKLSLVCGSKLSVSLDKNVIKLIPVQNCCVLCGGEDLLLRDLKICERCVERIKEM